MYAPKIAMASAGHGTQAERIMKTFFTEQMVCPSFSFSPSAEKPRHVMASWAAAGIPLEVEAPAPATVDELCLAHDAAFVRGVLAGERGNGFGNRRSEVAAALPFTTGAMLSAARWVIAQGGVAAAPCSGFHHAAWDRPAGFCTFNGLMVTALALAKEGRARRVGILDFDQHYGDGTDDILAHLGIDWIAHVTAGKRDWSAREVPEFLGSIEGWVRAMRECDVILYQAGADPHVDDPLGGWLDTEQLLERDRRVFRAARGLRVPLVWNLAGGYQEPLRRVLDIHDNTARACVEVYG
jgi:acetoin utilization deacetylase AcuC-like enzyme